MSNRPTNPARVGPILRAWTTRSANRRRVEGLGGPLRSWGGFTLALLLAVPIVNEMFMGWVTGPASQHHDAISELLLRSGLLTIGWIALDTYSALIRDGDREVLSIWPIDPGEVALYELVRLALGKLWMVLAAGVLFGPVFVISPSMWALTLVHTFVTAVLALAASGMVVLAAVDASDHPAAQPFLDLVRGQNHPAQAAFIYAPAFVLAAVGLASAMAANGVVMVLSGTLAGWMLLLFPLPVAGLLFATVPRLARRNWFRAGHVMAEVDARYAILEDQEERLSVYLDWTVRFLPERVALYALRDLRHGWRERRTWITGAWLAGLGALVASWGADADGPAQTALVVALAVWWLAAVSLRLSRDEPEFLVAWLPPDPREQTLARVFVVALWLQPVVWMGALGALFWRGPLALALVLLVGLGSVALATTASALLARRGGMVVYGPLAAVVVLITARGVLG